MSRRYETTHPWIDFHADLTRLEPATWILLAEARAHCDHIAGVPLRPEVAKELQMISLVRGVHATTSIEGNTLSEEHVRARVLGDLPLPPSRDYLGREVDNILSALNGLVERVLTGKRIAITAALISALNHQALQGLPLEEGTVPGELRSHAVGVGRYRGAPSEDVPFLVERLCRWLDDMGSEQLPGGEFTVAILQAILAHLYLAWIHPFGDGNGRVARLVEYAILFQSGIPAPAAHLLSNHYNLTRSRYYAELDRSSRRHPYDPTPFISYALQGFVDGLKEQLQTVRAHQLHATWVNYVHDRFEGEDTLALRRQKHLVLDLPDTWTPRAAIRRVSVRLAEEYGRKTSKTITRDLNALERRGLVERDHRGIRPRRELVEAFLPVRAPE